MAKLEKEMCAAVLMAASVLLPAWQMAFAGQDAEQQDAPAASIEQPVGQDDASPAEDVGTQAADAGEAAPDAAVPASAGTSAGGEANAGNDVKVPEKKPAGNTLRANAGIPSTNPDDADKHPAWRKREANKGLVDLPGIRRSMMQQGGQ